jgi:hypothetical protein
MTSLCRSSTHGVSMTRFESRPARSGQWEYYFYIDLQGHPSQPQRGGRAGGPAGPVRLLQGAGNLPGGCVTGFARTKERGEPSGVWMFEQLGLIGCGLMGGSFALAHEARQASSSAWSATASRRPPRERALSDGRDRRRGPIGAAGRLGRRHRAAGRARVGQRPRPAFKAIRHLITQQHAGHGRWLHQARCGRRRTPRAARSDGRASCRPTRSRASEVAGVEQLRPRPVHRQAGHPHPHRAHAARCT